MASRDQATFMETLLAFKRALKRKAYESDSDSSIDQATNRGNKLKKRARYVHEGQLAPPTGPSTYKEVVEHAGYRREIIYRNPPLIDEDGYEIESDDDEERIQEAVTAAAESNPYAGIRLESILAPLTTITDLPTHPTLSRPLTSKALTELSGQGCNWMHKENSALWKVKPLLTKLCGDHNWVACDLMVTAADPELFEDDYVARVSSRTTNGSASASGDTQRVHTPRLNGDGHSDHPNGQVNGDSEKSAQANGAKEAPPQSPDADVSMVDASATEEKQMEETPSKDSKKINGDKLPQATEQTDQGKLATDEVPAKAKPTDDEETNNDNNNHTGNGVNKNEEEKETTETPSKDAPKASDNPVTKDTHTPAQSTAAADEGQDAAPPVPPPPAAPPSSSAAAAAAAAAAPSNPAPSELNGSRALSLTPDVFDDQLVHPLFLAPRSARPERDLGLPEQEAEDVRRLLQLWVQKQEEVARGTKKLYEGLLKADRLRATVFKWAKAEAHAGANRDMSDGEDWYDKEEWGLVDDLKKGHDEEEEDTQQTQKKTRNRR